MNTQVNLGKAWEAMLALPQEQWDLCHAALLIAAQLQPDLVVGDYEERLASMAHEVTERIRDDMDVAGRIGEINSFLYDDAGFAGDKENYYLPENSLLNKVLERQRGIPITLAAIYLRLAEAAGLQASGIGFPGHYLVGIKSGRARLVLDPFDHGKLLDFEQLRTMLQQMTQKPVSETVLEKNLQPASKADSVVRMLRNLKQIYIEAQAVESALSCIEMILSIQPDSPDELRDRGMVYQHIEYTQGAINDLTRYLKLVPDAEERNVIESLLDSLQTQHKSLH